MPSLPLSLLRLTRRLSGPTVISDSKSIAEVSFLLFVLGGIAGILNMRLTLPFGAGFEMVALATNLAQHGTFANPLLVLPTGPSAATPPLYPAFLALLMKLLGGSQLVVLVAAIANAIANATSAALLPRVSLLIYGDAAPGIIGSIFWILSAQLMPSWDVSFTICALLFFVICSFSNLTKVSVIASAGFAGILAGLMLLLNPMTLLVILPWLIYLAIIRVTSLQKSLAYGAIVLAIAMVMVFPWMLRNHYELGSFVMRTSFGRTIYASNVDCSKTSLVEDLQSGCAAAYQANFDLGEAVAYRDLGEVDYDHVRLAAAKAWIRSHPRHFLRLTFSRIVAFWFPRAVEYPFKTVVIWIFTLLSIPGLIIMVRHRVPATAFFVLTLLVYPLVYYVVVSDVRYRYPVLWLSLLPAGYFLVRVFRGRQTKLRQVSQK